MPWDYINYFKSSKKNKTSWIMIQCLVPKIDRNCNFEKMWLENQFWALQFGQNCWIKKSCFSLGPTGVWSPTGFLGGWLSTLNTLLLCYVRTFSKNLAKWIIKNSFLKWKYWWDRLSIWKRKASWEQNMITSMPYQHVCLLSDSAVESVVLDLMQIIDLLFQKNGNIFPFMKARKKTVSN